MTQKLPNKSAILKFINTQSSSVGKREICQAFGIKGADRIWLKQLLKEMTAEGLIERQRKKIHHAEGLPPVAILTIFARDNNGELIAQPNNWNESQGEPPPHILIPHKPNSRQPQPGLGDQVLAKIERAPLTGSENKIPNAPAYTAKIIRILGQSAPPLLGIVQKTKDGAYQIAPTNKKQKAMRIHKDDISKVKIGNLVSAQADTTKGYGLPYARIIDVLDDMRSEQAISTIALHTHDIPHTFPEDALNEAEEMELTQCASREDWRHIPLITIDPADAKDHDDAVYAERDPDPNNPDGYVVTVAIADVAAFVRPGAALDRQAYLRGNSVYFPGRVVPMLPERISNNLCSLRAHEDRPALAVRMHFDAQGHKKQHSFHRIIMRAIAKLSYTQAQNAIDGHCDPVTEPILDPVLQPLWQAYAALQTARDARNPLELNLPERKILLKTDGTVDRVFIPPRLTAHRLIEEFMIQANVAAAQTLEAQKSPLVYRIHDSPSLEKVVALRAFLSSLEINLARGRSLRPHHFNAILEKVDNTERQDVVGKVILRTQSQAEYSPSNIGHFGLNLHRYAHFTSPIRRYADLIVHRALIKALKLGDDGLTEREATKLDDIAEHISMTERRAMRAERDTIDRLIAAHLASHIGADFPARISGVTKSGLFVTLNETGADGFVPASHLGHDYFYYDEAQHALIGKQSLIRFRIGDEVEVKLIEAAPLAGALRFEMLSPGTRIKGTRIKGKPIKRAKGRTHKKRKKSSKLNKVRR